MKGVELCGGSLGLRRGVGWRAGEMGDEIADGEVVLTFGLGLL